MVSKSWLAASITEARICGAINCSPVTGGWEGEVRAESVGGGDGICHVLWVHSVLRLTHCPRFWGQVLQFHPCLCSFLKHVTYICWHWVTFLLFATNILESPVRLPMAIIVEELLSLP